MPSRVMERAATSRKLGDVTNPSEAVEHKATNPARSEEILPLSPKSAVELIAMLFIAMLFNSELAKTVIEGLNLLTHWSQAFVNCCLSLMDLSAKHSVTLGRYPHSRHT